MIIMKEEHDDDILLPTGVDGESKHPDEIDDILYPPGVGPSQEDRKGRDLPPMMDE